MDPEELEFLKAIHADPKDDNVRLVYADWLDEHAESPIECEKCKGLGTVVYCSRFMYSCGELGFECDCGTTKQCETCLGGGRVDGPRALQSRFIRNGILLANVEKDGNKDSVEYRRLAEKDTKLLYLCQLNGRKLHEIPYTVSVRFSRGFLSQITCPADWWVRNADDIYWQPGKEFKPSFHPIEKVVFSSGPTNIHLRNIPGKWANDVYLEGQEPSKSVCANEVHVAAQKHNGDWALGTCSVMWPKIEFSRKADHIQVQNSTGRVLYGIRANGLFGGVLDGPVIIPPQNITFTNPDRPAEGQ